MVFHHQKIIQRWKIVSLPMLLGLMISLGCNSNYEKTRTSSYTSSEVPDKEPGDPLFAPIPFSKPDTGVHSKMDPILLPSCSVMIDPTMRRDVPSREEGIIAYIGVEKNKNPITMTEDQNVQEILKNFRPLTIGDKVDANQPIAILEPTRAKLDVIIAKYALVGAKKQIIAAKNVLEEAKANLKLTEKGSLKRAIAELDVHAARASVARYEAELEAKIAEESKIGPELEKAKEKFSKHTIVSPIRGEVVQIYKQPGESIKANDTVIQIVNFDRLEVEGSLERQFAQRLRAGMKASVEPNILRSPEQTQDVFHRGRAITAIAFSQNTPIPMIISAAEDNLAVVWDLNRNRLQTWKFPGIVRAIACTGKESKESFVLLGNEDGYARIFDLNHLGEEPRITLKDRHEGGVRAVTFSPNGEWCVTADGVRNLFLWETATGNLIYRFPQKHNDYVTSLFFLPQCRVVSVGKDNTLRQWKIGKDAAQLEKDKSILHRTGEVSQIGMTEDGNQILVDYSKSKLHLVHLWDTQTERVLQQVNEATSFRLLALFSPPIGPKNQRLILTANNSSNLTLWRAPSKDERGSELCQLVLPHDNQPTFAAFSPNANQGVIAVGTKQGEIHLWTMPTSDEINHHWIGTIEHIDSTVDTSGRSVKVTVSFDNPADDHYRLRPGTNATLVIDPIQK